LWPALERVAYIDAATGETVVVDLPRVWVYLCKLAVATGLRIGELAALRWRDVDLLARELHVSVGFTYGIGEEPTKSNEPRTIDLTPQAAKLLESWFERCTKSNDGDASDCSNTS
jgi:integrase